MVKIILYCLYNRLYSELIKSTHETQLRHLIELLDGAVGNAYKAAGLNYRPRYTPVMRSLMTNEPATIGFIAKAAGITQPAATQTVALMIKDGIVSVEASLLDARQKMIRLTPQGRDLIPQLKLCWQATAIAAASFEADLPFPLSEVLDSAIRALAKKPFGERIREARARLEVDNATTKKGGEMKTIKRALISGLLISAFAFAPAGAQMRPDPAQPDLVMDAAQRQLVIDAMLKELHKSYVFPEQARKVEVAIRQHQKKGDYDSITSADKLSDVLAAHVFEQTNDKHLRMFYSAKPIPDQPTDKKPSAEKQAQMLAGMKSQNFGVERVERLPFNIGYLDLRAFAPAKDAADTLAAAMTLLAHTDSMIIDFAQKRQWRSGHGHAAGQLPARRALSHDGYLLPRGQSH